MTSPQTATGSYSPAQIGTQVLIGWSGEHPERGHDVAFLLTYSLGDGPDGPETGSAALRAALGRAGLRVGGGVLDASEHPSLPVKLLVQAGQAVLTLPHFTAQYPAPPEWVAAALSTGQVYGMFATRPWPEAVAGRPVSEDRLRAFAASPETVSTAAHCLMPVRSLG
ncbi:DUF5949 family protein [uncultured Streptomyces sp.]|uniref:DUF5949 family protein n=1 Tax=uncultured Streptomyces sp. TaxID=174707 RepID=UPI002629BD91|nr:DUF5949 family protein [uncultured Streptomyces sp.]